MENTEQRTKTCPFCAETILEAAKKCKHCGEFLEESSRPPIASTTGATPAGAARGGNGVAAVLSFFVPGLGQIYKGKLAAGIGWLFGAIILAGLTALVFPFGVILFIYALVCVKNAYDTDDPMASKSTIDTEAQDSEVGFPCPRCGKTDTALVDIENSTATWECSDCKHRWADSV